MKRFLFVLGLCLVGAGLGLATPAQATTACGTEFIFYAKTKIAFENGDTNVIGNVLVSGPSGIVTVGNQVSIDGRVTAHEIKLGTGAVVAECKADIISGDGICLNSNLGTFSGVNPVDPTCLTYPEIDPVVLQSCPDAADQTFSGPNNSLGAGCYGALRVLDFGILSLSGVIDVKSIRLGAGSQVSGPATVNIKGGFVTENNVKLTDLDINSAQQAGELALGNSSTLSNVTMNAPGTRIHIRTGWVMKNNSELVAERLAVQPGDSEPPDEFPPCICPAGSTPSVPSVCIPD